MTDVNKLVSQMTLEEKAGLLNGLDFWHLKGVERLGIPSVMVTDGPHGLRKQAQKADHLSINESVKAVCFPAACALASSFDRELVYAVGEAIGKECQAEDVSVILGPGANIKRSPLCGRNFEYFSEDPYQSGEMAAAQIQGVQSQNVGTSLKHYCANNQETRRMSVNAHIDERTFRELYLANFETAVKKGKPWTVMCNYNQINGVFGSQNPLTLQTILRDEWGFDGYTVTDWGACVDHVKGVLAGLDLQMPSGGAASDRKLVAAVQDGTVSEAVLDEAAKRILTIVYRYLDNRKPDTVFDYEGDHEKARDAAGECAVLLKNDDHLLPLAKGQKLALIGKYAKEPRYQGSGSSRINVSAMTSALDAVHGMANIVYAQGFDDAKDVVDEALMAEAVKVAKAAEVAVLFVGLPGSFESEGFDRTHMRMPDNQLALIERVAEVNDNLVVVLHNGAPMEMPWLPKAKSVLEMYLGGQAVGGATVDLLFGAKNPSGKLAETFPVKLSDNPSYLNFPGDGDDVYYNEGLYVGYRYYDQKQMPVLFPFGYGLSYTTFAYSNARADGATLCDGDTLTVRVDVTNTGKTFGKEIVQLYVASAHKGVSRPQKELKGFRKVALRPGETKTVSFTLDRRSFAYYECYLHDWYVENGAYMIMLGASSADIRLELPVEYTQSPAWRRPITTDSTFGDVMDVPGAMGIIAPILDGFKQGLGIEEGQNEGGTELGDAGSAMMIAMMRDMPIHALSSFAGEAFPDQAMHGLIAAVNALP